MLIKQGETFLLCYESETLKWGLINVIFFSDYFTRYWGNYFGIVASLIRFFQSKMPVKTGKKEFLGSSQLAATSPNMLSSLLTWGFLLSAVKTRTIYFKF